jgi:hypothetical protein
LAYYIIINKVKKGKKKKKKGITYSFSLNMLNQYVYYKERTINRYGVSFRKKNNSYEEIKEVPNRTELSLFLKTQDIVLKFLLVSKVIGLDIRP